MLEGRNPLENLGKWVFIISALGWFILLDEGVNNRTGSPERRRIEDRPGTGLGRPWVSLV